MGDVRVGSELTLGKVRAGHVAGHDAVLHAELFYLISMQSASGDEPSAPVFYLFGTVSAVVTAQGQVCPLRGWQTVISLQSLGELGDLQGRFLLFFLLLLQYAG